jgi:hypothetical protein
MAGELGCKLGQFEERESVAVIGAAKSDWTDKSQIPLTHWIMQRFGMDYAAVW